MAKGLDVGTVNLVAAVRADGNKTEFRKQRNAFVETPVDNITKNLLTKLEVQYIVQNDILFILGDKAFELANVLNKEIRRPMRSGMISPREIEAIPIMKLLIENIIGKPSKPNELCYYTIPAEPIDAELNVIYHQEVFNKLVSSLGYTPSCIVEGRALALAELADDNFTGIAISCGGGMFNVCVCFEAVPCISFSIARGGDWIDENAAKVLGIRTSRVTMIKEQGIDLSSSKSREEEAISIYYRALVNYTLSLIKEKLELSQDLPQFPSAVTLALGGGTILAKGFTELIKQELDRTRFPLRIKDVKLSKEPLNAIAQGALTAALLEEENE
ncbi:MAG: hypothetical protein HY606_03365 [Planctomycetes bacterium]|nr:hypothetical protein [Planctomycetota bacterium]